jgi:hypothetical protein
MKLRSKEIRHPAHEPVRNAFRKLRGARSLYDQAKEQFDEKVAMIGFCVLIMWEMRKSFGSIVKSLGEQDDSNDDWLWNLNLELDIENSSENEVIWEPTTVEVFCDRGRTSSASSSKYKQGRRRRRHGGLRQHLSTLEWFKIALGLDDDNLKRRQRRNRSELMATLSFWSDDDRSEDESLCVKSGIHRYKVGATLRVPRESKQRWKSMFRGMFTNKNDDDVDSKDDDSSRKGGDTLTSIADRITDALIRTSNIQGVLRDNIKFFREELGRILDRYDIMQPLWDVRVVLQTEHLDIPSCLSFVSAPKICLPVIERSKLCFGNNNNDDNYQKNKNKRSGQNEKDDEKEDDEETIHSRMMRDSGMERFNKTLRNRSEGAKDAHEIRNAFMKAFLEDDEGSLVEVILRLMKLYQYHVDDPESSVSNACEIVEYFCWDILIDVLRDAFGRREFREERRARGRDESVDVDWKFLKRAERAEYFQRSRYKYLFRLLEWCLVHFRDSMTYEKFKTSTFKQIESGVSKMKWPTVRQWLESNSLLFVFADNDSSNDGVTKLEMMNLLRELGVRNAYLSDLREVESKQLEQFRVRDIYVQKFFKRLSSQTLPRPSIPPRSISTVESVLKYLRMQHATRALQFYDLNRLSELSESSLVGKGLKIVEARVLQRTLRMMGIASDPSDVAARSARDLKEILQFLNMSSFLNAFKSKNLSLIELSSLDSGDLEDLGVKDEQKRELFIRTARKIEQRIMMERSKTIGEICDILSLSTSDPKRPVGDLLACETIGDLRENFAEVTFLRGQEETFLRLASSLREKENLKSSQLLLDEEEKNDNDDVEVV